MLELRHLSKSFGGLKVTHDVALKVQAGSRHAILGPNGAGKTTLFNLLTGTLPPSSGEIWLNGQNITHLPPHQRARLGLSRSYQRNNLFETLTVQENLGLAAAAGGELASILTRDTFRDAKVQMTVARVAEQVGLQDLLQAPVRQISYGNRRQLELGLALATNPSLLLLDEPTSGIGPNLVGTFKNLILNLPRSLTVVVIEHDLQLAFDIADHITLLNFGEVVFSGTPDEARNSALVRDIYLGDWKTHA
jgi:branched-chain amino acid transport system ATP-binding protein